MPKPKATTSVQICVCATVSVSNWFEKILQGSGVLLELSSFISTSEMQMYKEQIRPFGRSGVTLPGEFSACSYYPASTRVLEIFIHF